MLNTEGSGQEDEDQTAGCVLRSNVMPSLGEIRRKAGGLHGVFAQASEATLGPYERVDDAGHFHKEPSEQPFCNRIGRFIAWDTNTGRQSMLGRHR